MDPTSQPANLRGVNLQSLDSQQSNLAPVLLKGRVLTRACVQRGGETILEYFVRTADGPVLIEVAGQHPMAFCHSQDAQRLLQGLSSREVSESPLPLQSFANTPVSALYCQSPQQLRLLVSRAHELAIPLFEADIKPEQRFLLERFVALDAEFYGYFSSETPARFKASRVRAAAADIPLKAVSLDIECSLSGELYSVGLYGDCAPKVIMVGAGASPLRYQPNAEVHVIDIIWVSDELSLLMALQQWFSEEDPDIVLGWAVISFDLSLLWQRAKLHGIRLNIGRYGRALGWKVADKHRPETLDLPGRVVLDGIDWLKAAFYHFDSFALDKVANALLGEGKVIDNATDRGEEITRLFCQDKAALAWYNLTDCRLVWDIFVKTALIDFALERAWLTGLELGRVGGSVAAFNHLYLPHLHRAGYVAPAMSSEPGPDSPGGYVMDSLPGLYRNVLVLDYKSLYPSIIRTFLIDPKGLLLGLKEPLQDTVPGFRGGRFSRRDPILPRLIEQLGARREQAKAMDNAALSQAVKIIMNSLYGVLGSRGCVFHDHRLASSITLRGHEIMQTTKTWIQDAGYRVIYGDTDSTFVWLGDDATNAEEAGRMLVDMVNRCWREQLADAFQLESYLELEFERHYQRFFMPTLRHSVEGSKKRYVGQYANGDERVLVFKGMEQVRSDWTPLARRVQHELYRRLFAEEDPVAFMRTVEIELFKGKLDQELIFTKRLKRDISQYTAKSAPHVRAATLLVDATGDAGHGKRGARINYVLTKAGAEPLDFSTQPLDYDYYLDRQLLPLLEPILAVLQQNYPKRGADQLMLI